MATLFGILPFLKTLCADSGYQGPKVNPLEATPIFKPCAGIGCELYRFVSEPRQPVRACRRRQVAESEVEFA